MHVRAFGLSLTLYLFCSLRLSVSHVFSFGRFGYAVWRKIRVRASLVRSVIFGQKPKKKNWLFMRSFDNCGLLNSIWYDTHVFIRILETFLGPTIYTVPIVSLISQVIFKCWHVLAFPLAVGYVIQICILSKTPKCNKTTQVSKKHVR